MPRVGLTEGAHVEHRGAGVGQGDPHLHGVGRGRKDHHRGGPRGRGRGESRRQGSGADRRPRQAAGQCAGTRAVRQRRDPGARRGVRRRRGDTAGVNCGPRCWTRSRAGTISIAHMPRTTATRDAILANPLYQNITGKFVQSHDYVAMERLYEIHTSGRYDLDRRRHPAHPKRRRFPRRPRTHGRLLLVAPAALADRSVSRSRVVSFASKPFYSVADRILGTTVPPGHRRVLHPLPVDVRRLRRAGRGGQPAHGIAGGQLRGGVDARGGTGARGGVLHAAARGAGPAGGGAGVSTRSCPATCAIAEAADVATDVGRRRRDGRGPRRGRPRPPGGRRDALAGARRDRPELRRTTAWWPPAKPEQRHELSAVPGTVASVPYFTHDIADLRGLLDMGEQDLAVTR